jgi:DnaA family protein
MTEVDAARNKAKKSSAKSIEKQLAFPPPFNHTAQFKHFFWQNNTVLREALLSSLDLKPQTERIFYLWGESGCGKSHLLQASCQLISPCAYLPLKELLPLGPDILENLEELSLIAIDDCELIAGHPEWEEALFHCYNKVLAQEKTRLLFASSKPLATLNIQLPDLLSRLQATMVFQVLPLDETACLALLEERAQQQGLEMPEEVKHFLIRRFPRNSRQLLEIFETLDKAAWQAQRRLTVPFVKKILGLYTQGHE